MIMKVKVSLVCNFTADSFVFPPRLLQFHQTVVKGSGGLPDELLYGRMGYLYSLVFINQQLGQDRIPLQYIQQVSTTRGMVSQKHFAVI